MNEKLWKEFEAWSARWNSFFIERWGLDKSSAYAEGDKADQLRADCAEHQKEHEQWVTRLGVGRKPIMPSGWEGRPYDKPLDSRENILKYIRDQIVVTDMLCLSQY